MDGAAQKPEWLANYTPPPAPVLSIAIISKAEAKAQGLKRYFTGIPCKRGHLSLRDMNGECCECRDALARAAGVPSRAAQAEQRQARNEAYGQVRAALMAERREAAAKLEALRAQQRAARREALRQATAIKMQERARKREERYIAKCEREEAKRTALILRLAEKGLPNRGRPPAPVVIESKDPRIISKAEALARKLTRYFTGKPCHVGHIAERDVFQGVCVECKSLKNGKRQKHKETALVPMVVLLRGLKIATRPPELEDQRTVREGMVNCLGRRAESHPHKFFSEDVRRIRICPSCKSGASREYLYWTE